MRGPKLETERFLLIIEQPPDLIRGIVRWGNTPRRAEINASRRTVAFALTAFTTPAHALLLLRNEGLQQPVRIST